MSCAPSVAARCRLLLCALGLAVLLVIPGTAAAAGIYTVSPVSVDVTAESAAKAREQALANAHERAFDRLVRRIVPARVRSRVPDAGYDRIGRLVRDFEVRNEKTSSVRYLADLTIRFQRKAVRAFLRENDVPFAETRSDPLVVLPVLGESGDARLWQERNPWRAAWSARPDDGGLVPLVVPLGDLKDMEHIDARAALDQRQKPLTALAARYDTSAVLVTQAIPQGAEAARVQVVSRRIGPDGQTQTWVESLRRRPEESRADLYARAAERVARAVERSWKLANVVRFESEAGLTARVPLDGLDRWVTVRRRLSEIPLVGEARLRRLSRAEAEVALVYYGDVAQLRRAMAQSELTLAEAAPDAGTGETGPGWIVRPADSGAASGRNVGAEAGGAGAGAPAAE